MSPKEKRILRGAPAGGDSNDQRGLDLLAATIDDVAEQLPPSNLVSFPPLHSSVEDPQRGTHWRGIALAASLAMVFLTWPAYLGWVRLPEVEQQLATARSLAPSTGPVELTWLSPPRQGGRSTDLQPVVQVEKPSSGTVVWLLELPMAMRDRLTAGARIELHQEASGQVEEWQLSGDQLAHQLLAHDGVPLLLTPSELVLGNYQLLWRDQTGQVISTLELQLVAP